MSVRGGRVCSRAESGACRQAGAQLQRSGSRQLQGDERVILYPWYLNWLFRYCIRTVCYDDLLYFVVIV